MAFRSLALSAGFLVILWGCGEVPGDPRNSGGSSGSGGTAGTAGSGGTGGVGGSGGSGGAGGCVFGCGGSGGTAARQARAARRAPAVQRAPVGRGAPAGLLAVVAAESSTAQPAFCVSPARAEASVRPAAIARPASRVSKRAVTMSVANRSSNVRLQAAVHASSSANCSIDRECVDVPGEGKRCVKTTPGCDTSFDCVLGFACENGSCVDRRVPCDPQDEQCPKNHVCGGTTNSNFCRRIQQECEFDFDCVDLAPRCEDIDGDSRKECAGTFDLNDPMSNACTNAQCGRCLGARLRSGQFREHNAVRTVRTLSRRRGLRGGLQLPRALAGWTHGMCAGRWELFELRGLPAATGLRIPTRWGRAQLPGGIAAMSSIANAQHRNTSSAAHWRVLGLLLLAAAVGCGEEPNGPRSGGGSSGTGGTAGTAGSGGAGCAVWLRGLGGSAVAVAGCGLAG